MNSYVLVIDSPVHGSPAQQLFGRVGRQTLSSYTENLQYFAAYSGLPRPLSVLSDVFCAAMNGAFPGSDWQRPCGRPHTSWVHQICSNTVLSASDTSTGTRPSFMSQRSIAVITIAIRLRYDYDTTMTKN